MGIRWKWSAGVLILKVERCLRSVTDQGTKLTIYCPWTAGDDLETGIRITHFQHPRRSAGWTGDFLAADPPKIIMRQVITGFLLTW